MLFRSRINNVKNSLMQTFESSYSTHFDYNNLLTSNYPLITDELLSNMGSMNFSVLKDFESMNVSGCSIINSNVEMNTLTEEAKEKVLKHAISIVRGNVQHEKKKLSSQDLKLELNSIHSVLIPIYYLKMKYKDKEYFFIMNGQTGDSIVTVPICASSIFLFCILCFAAIFGICYLIAHLM